MNENTDRMHRAEGLQDAMVDSHCLEVGEKLLESVADSYVDAPGAEDAVRSLLQSQVDVNYVGAPGSRYEGMFPLILAAAVGSESITKVLIDATADVKQCVGAKYLHETNAATALQQCCVDGNVDLVRLLVDKSDLESANCNGKTAFLLAVESGNTELIEYLAQSRCDVNSIDDRGNNAAHLASGLPMDIVADVICILQRCRVNFDLVNNDGLTPLKHAAMTTNIAAVKAMLESGQCTLSYDTEHLSELEASLILGEHDKTRHLLHASDNQVDNIDTLCLFIRHANADTVNELLRMHNTLQGRINDLITNAGGITPLLAACMMGNIDMAGVLLRHGANPSITSLGGVTPLKKAVLLNHVPLVRLLLSQGGTTDHINDNDAKLLQLALFVKNVSMAKLLIGSGCVSKMCEALTNVVAKINNYDLLAIINAAGHRSFLKAFQTANDKLRILDRNEECQDELEHWLKCILKNPASLQALCRLTIRQSLSYHVVTKLDRLSLPATLNNYILLTEYE